MGFRHGKPFYEWYDEHPALAARFAQAQKGIVKSYFLACAQMTVMLTCQSGSRGRCHFRMVCHGRAQAWFEAGRRGCRRRELDRCPGRGEAHSALLYEPLTDLLQQQNPSLHFVAQDLYPKFYEATRANLSPELASRVSFAEHDFFKPQPHDPDVGAYLLRSCLHNWADADAKRILQAFGETLAKNREAKLLINEIVLPRKGEVSMSQEQEARRSDVAMFVIANSKQRSEEDWRSLVRGVDCGLDVSVHALEQLNKNAFIFTDPI